MKQPVTLQPRPILGPNGMPLRVVVPSIEVDVVDPTRQRRVGFQPPRAKGAK